MFARDTSREAATVQARVLRGMSGARKLEAMNALSLMAHSLVRAGIRERLPRATEAEREAEYFRLVLGAALAERVLEYRRRVRAGGSGPESP